MVRVNLENISNFILKDVSLEIPSNKLTFITGPNGAGKTTLLKVMAGLVNYSGNVLFDGRLVNDLPPHLRGISYVPQNNALFTHMKVRENIAFGLKVRKLDVAFIERRVNELLEMFHLEKVADEYPARLSGGEAKKVALARALAIEPKILLLDEPFVNLDYTTRHIVEQEIITTIKNLKSTVIMVTHSVEKAMENADKLTIIWDGRLVFDGKPYGLSEEALPFEVRWWFGTILDADGFSLAPRNKKVEKVYVPPNSIKLVAQGGLKAKIKKIYKNTNHYRIIADLGGNEIYLLIPFKPKMEETINLDLGKVIPITGE